MLTEMPARSRSSPKPPVEFTDPSRPRVLVVEDEQDLQELLCYNLERDGFDAACVSSGELALKVVKNQKPDLVLLDLMLPGIDGLEICRRIKANPDTASIPIIMLTAKGEEADIVTGLELGADDYIVKPFSPRVLLARLRAVKRRKPAPETASQDDDQRTVIRAGDFTIHIDRHEVLIQGDPVELTATEFRLFCLLARHPGRVYGRQQIVDAIHGQLVAVTDRSIDVLIVGLRRKLGEHGACVQTVRGVGYRFKG